MEFLSNWITTSDFIDLKPIDMFHKENDKKDLPESKYKNYHVHFRKKFVLEDTENVFIDISADDYYKLYLNGAFVCQGPAPAYPSDYKFNRINLSPYLKKGENVIAVHVYYQGLINRVWVSADNRQGMIADVYKDGKFLFGTDETWHYSIAKEFCGDTVGYETAFLENIDFNLEEKGWTNIDFDDSAYENAVLKCDADYKFADKPADTLDVYKKMPEKIIKIDKGKYFVDFGEEITGQFYMKVKGYKGQKVRILCGEETEADNRLLARHDMRCNCDYDETCTLSSKTDEFNFFDYKAFRYVNVFTDEDNLKPDSFCAIVRHHKFKERIKLRSDIPYLEDIWRICKNALKYGGQESLLDCPSREKGVYLGDFTVSGLAHLYLTGDKKYYKKTLYDFANTKDICNGIMAVADCSLMQEIADFSLQYPLQLLNYYSFTKDIDTIKDLYPTACGILEYFKNYERKDGLIENVYGKWNLVDWPKNLRDDYNAWIEREEEVLDCHNVLNAFYIGAIDAVNQIRDILSIDEKTDTSGLKKAFIKAFYNEKTRLFCDNEEKTHSALHSNVLPLYFDIADKAMENDLKKFIVKKGLCCGVQFSYFVLKSLGKIEAFKEELDLIVNESKHSWVNMIREGATTCFEAWGKEQKWNTSLCHPWASAPVIAIVEDLKDKFEITLEEI